MMTPCRPVRSRRIAASLALSLLMDPGAAALAQAPVPADAQPPASSGPSGALPPGGFGLKEEIQSSGDPRLDTILDRLESNGKNLVDMKARLKKQEIETFPVPETQSQEGEIMFIRREPDSRFLVRFDKLTVGGIVKDTPRDRQWFAFDGRWLIERNDNLRRVIRREAVAKGQRVDVFKLGNGPFPLPIGQSRQDMLSNFEIKLKPPVPGDPPQTDHLECIPRKESEVAERFRRVDFFVDQKLELPIRIDAVEKRDEVELRVEFSDVRLNSGLPASSFELEIPGDYAVTEEPLETAVGAPAPPP